MYYNSTMQHLSSSKRNLEDLAVTLDMLNLLMRLRLVKNEDVEQLRYEFQIINYRAYQALND